MSVEIFDLCIKQIEYLSGGLDANSDHKAGQRAHR